ncbi:chemokine (C-C motif) ligand 34b, duplicate 4 isoform X1 [Misgurnus anguillicaudatus]|uniref:chemokine (C-C motif) ligand 34b, duplicate 4 isoform X1 n=1 Tax=Misgurnus anguillicaudatus TaxID=75329 RepID=UPI003CCF1770
MMGWTSKLFVFAVLFTLMGCFTGALGNFRRPTRVGVNCCKEVSNARIPAKMPLIGYKHQNALDPCVEAIIFYTTNEKYCSDPKARWISHRMKGLKEIKD